MSTFSLLLMQTKRMATTKNKKAALQGLKMKLRRGRSRQLATSRLSQQKIHFLALCLEYKVARKGTRQAKMKVGTKMRKSKMLLGPPSTTVSVATGSVFSIINQYLHHIHQTAKLQICTLQLCPFQCSLLCKKLNQRYLYNMKDSLLSKSCRVDEEFSLQSERESYDHRSTLSATSTRKPKKVPSKKIISTIRDESYQLEMQNFGVLRSIVGLYQRFPILNPQSRAMLISNILNFTIIIFYLIEIGLIVGFGEIFWQDELKYFYEGNIFFIVFFLMDILLSPLKAFYSNGIMIISRVVIFKRYSRFYLWLDLVAFLSVLAPYVSLSFKTNYFKLLFFVKLIPAYDLDRYLLMYVKNQSKRSHVYGLLRLILMMVLWAHWFGVGFFALDYWVYSSNFYGPNTPNYCWIYNSALNFNITQQHWSVQYLYSLYFSIGNITTIAYGDIVPRNPVEAVYAIFAMTFAILLFTYFFKSMIQLLFDASAEEIDNQRDFSVIKRFLKNNQVNKTLSTKIKSYFETNWLQGKFKNSEIERQLIEKLPKQLKLQLNIVYYSDFIIQLGIQPQDVDLKLSSSHSSFICQLSQVIQTQKVMAGELIYSQGQLFEQQDCVYFCDVNLGKLGVSLGVGQIVWPHAELFLQQHKTDEDLYQLYGSNLVLCNISGLFGEQSFFTQNPRSHWAVANKQMDILKLSRSKFDALLDHYASKAEKERIALLKEDVSTRFCYICKQKGHLLHKCNYATYVPSDSKLIERLKLQNTRVNNSIITRQRESWLSFTNKQNPWKLSTKLKQQHQTYLSKQERKIEIQEQPQQSQGMEAHIFEQLATLRALVHQHSNKKSSKVETYKQGVNVDEVELYSLYRPKYNITEEINQCNLYLKKKSRK